MELISARTPQYKANLHSHSNISDGALTPEQMKQGYREHGYSILAVTDHEAPYAHNELTEPDFLMLTGYEAYIRTTDGKMDAYAPECHCNLIARDPENVAFVNYRDGYCKYVKDPAAREAFHKVGKINEPREYSVAYINDFIRIARENGYLVTLNHPVWSMESEENLFGYEGWFSMEMCNYSSYLGREEYNAPLYDRMLAAGKRVYCHSGDDNHNKSGNGTWFDSFGGFTYILAEELTYPAVIRALERGDFYSSMGPQILSLSVDGTHAHIETTPAVRISMVHGSKNIPCVRGTSDAPVTKADFEIPERAPYIRFSVTDAAGKHADTRGYFRDEIG